MSLPEKLLTQIYGTIIHSECISNAKEYVCLSIQFSGLISLSLTMHLGTVIYCRPLLCHHNLKYNLLVQQNTQANLCVNVSNDVAWITSDLHIDYTEVINWAWITFCWFNITNSSDAGRHIYALINKAIISSNIGISPLSMLIYYN